MFFLINSNTFISSRVILYYKYSLTTSYVEPFSTFFLDFILRKIIIKIYTNITEENPNAV